MLLLNRLMMRNRHSQRLVKHFKLYYGQYKKSQNCVLAATFKANVKFKQKTFFPVEAQILLDRHKNPKQSTLTENT